MAIEVILIALGAVILFNCMLVVSVSHKIDESFLEFTRMLFEEDEFEEDEFDE